MRGGWALFWLYCKQLMGLANASEVTWMVPWEIFLVMYFIVASCRHGMQGFPSCPPHGPTGNERIWRLPYQINITHKHTVQSKDTFLDLFSQLQSFSLWLLHIDRESWQRWRWGEKKSEKNCILKRTLFGYQGDKCRWKLSMKRSTQMLHMMKNDNKLPTLKGITTRWQR